MPRLDEANTDEPHSDWQAREQAVEPPETSLVDVVVEQDEAGGWLLTSADVGHTLYGCRPPVHTWLKSLTSLLPTWFWLLGSAIGDSMTAVAFSPPDR